jgi:hypothetical protein
MSDHSVGSHSSCGADPSIVHRGSRSSSLRWLRRRGKEDDKAHGMRADRR